MQREKFESLSFYNLNTWYGAPFRLPISDISLSNFIFESILEINNTKHYCFKAFSYEVYFIYIGDETINKENISDKIINQAHKFIVHREDNKPAILHSNTENSMFFKYGKLHRDNDLPAYFNDNRSYWFNHGFLYRKNAPAKTEFTYNHEENFEFIIFEKKVEESFELIEKYENVIINNVKHIKYTNNLNQTIYFCNNKIHREDDEPAFSSSSLKIWYKNGLIHRMYKPAIFYNYYYNNNEYYYKSGKSLSDEEIEKEKFIKIINTF